jgi:hypothetical protein
MPFTFEKVRLPFLRNPHDHAVFSIPSLNSKQFFRATNAKLLPFVDHSSSPIQSEIVVMRHQ